MTVYDMYCAREEEQLVDRVILVVDEIQRGLSTYGNFLFIEQFHRTNGLTSDFRDLIGDESIVESIGTALKKFWGWVVKKLQDLVKALREFFDRILTRILALFGITRKNSFVGTSINSELSGILNPEDFKTNDCVIQIPYKLQNLLKACTYLSTLFPINFSGNENMDEIVVAVINNYNSFVGEDTNTHEYKKSEVYKVLDALCSTVGHCDSLRKTLENNANTIISYVHNTPTARINVDKLIQMFSKGNTVVGFQGISGFGKACARYQYEQCGDTPVTNEIVLQIATVVILRALSCGCKMLVGVVSPIPKVIRTVSAAYNKEHAQVHLRYDLDHDLKKRIEKELGGSLKISNIYMTTISSMSWPRVYATDSVSAAACYAWTDRTGAVDIWVNIRYLLKAKVVYLGKILDRRTSVLRSIVHECVHCYDAQHGVVFTGAKDPKDNFKEYSESAHEQHADNVADNFVFTNSDYKWLDRIIADVTKAIGSKRI